MDKDNKIVSTRYVTFTTIFHEKVKSLGFKLREEKKGSEGFLKFTKGPKTIISSFKELVLISGENKIKYRGLTVDKDILEFFSKREPLTVQKNENNSSV